MKILLDTCTFLWIVSGAKELSETARATFLNSENDIFLSSASAWEITIKHSLGRLPLPGSPEKVVPLYRDQHGIESLPIDEESALRVVALPSLHKDPFDRLLVAQAIVSNLIVLTPDALIAQYGIRTVW